MVYTCRRSLCLNFWQWITIFSFFLLSFHRDDKIKSKCVVRIYILIFIFIKNIFNQAYYINICKSYIALYLYMYRVHRHISFQTFFFFPSFSLVMTLIYFVGLFLHILSFLSSFLHFERKKANVVDWEPLVNVIFPINLHTLLKKRGRKKIERSSKQTQSGLRDPYVYFLTDAI